jgi:hypothetical protein
LSKFSETYQAVAIILIAFLILCQIPGTAFADDKDEFLEKSGDILQVLLPGLAIGSTFISGNPEGGMWDREGTKQSIYTVGSALAVSTTMKFLVAKMRPNGNNRTSFPSGHTTAVFSGAAFINQRYGWKWGVPSLALATWTGYTRVYSDWHFADDVVAGASIGLMSAWMFTTPRSESFAISPVTQNGGTGVSVSVAIDGDGTLDEAYADGWKPNWRYNFAFGPADLAKNEITAPSGTGTTFDLADFAQMDNPTTTAMVTLEYDLSNKFDFLVFYSPFESRDTAVINENIDFGGKTFLSGTTVRSAWVLHDIRVGAVYNVSRYFEIGAGLYTQFIRVTMTSQTDSTSAKVTDEAFLPLIYVGALYELSKKFDLALNSCLSSIGNDRLFDISFMVRWQAHPRWDLNAGFWHYERDIETTDLKNNTVYNGPYLAVAYVW